MSGTYRFDPSSPDAAYRLKLRHHGRRSNRQVRTRQREFMVSAASAQSNEPMDLPEDEQYAAIARKYERV